MHPLPKTTNRIRWRASVLGIVALLAAGFVTVPAGAHHPPTSPVNGCGQEIDSTFVGSTFMLTHHVGPCVGDGLVVTRSGVLNATSTGCSTYFTVDLKGWDIFGTVASDDGVGIRITNQTCVKVTNSNYTGAVTSGGGASASEIYEFDGGVVIKGGAYNEVEKVSVHSSGDGQSPANYGDGIAIENSSNNTVTNNFVGTDGTDPMLCSQGDVVAGAHAKDCGAIPHLGYDPANPGAQNAHSKVTARWGANGAFSGIGIYDFAGASTLGNKVHHNVIRNNYRCFTLGEGSCQSDGVRLEGALVSSNTIESNEITGGALDGLGFLLGPDNNSILNNVIEGNGKHHRTHRKGDGVRLFSGANGNTFSGNRVCGNAAYGIRIDAGASGNTVSSNNAGGTGCTPNGAMTTTAEDLYDGDTTGPAPGYCDTNSWTGNSFGDRNQNPAVTGEANCIS